MSKILVVIMQMTKYSFLFWEKSLFVMTGHKQWPLSLCIIWLGLWSDSD